MSAHAENRQNETETMHAASREINHLLEVKAVMLQALEEIHRLATIELNGTGRMYYATNRADIAATSSRAIRLAKGERP
jgi:hypothetical protein